MYDYVVHITRASYAHVYLFLYTHKIYKYATNTHQISKYIANRHKSSDSRRNTDCLLN